MECDEKWGKIGVTLQEWIYVVYLCVLLIKPLVWRVTATNNRTNSHECGLTSVKYDSSLWVRSAVEIRIKQPKCILVIVVIWLHFSMNGHEKGGWNRRKCRHKSGMYLCFMVVCLIGIVYAWLLMFVFDWQWVFDSVASYRCKRQRADEKRRPCSAIVCTRHEPHNLGRLGCLWLYHMW